MWGAANQRSGSIHSAVTASIAFHEQKNGDKSDETTQQATTDPLLNLVRVLAHLASELWNLPGTIGDTPPCTFHDEGSKKTVSASDALHHLRK